MNEHLTKGRGVAAVHIVPEFLAADRDVVQHKISHKVILLAKPIHVIPRAEARVYNVIPDYGKALVAGRGKKRQDVDAAERAGKILCQHAFQLRKAAAQRVGIRDQHDFIFDFFIRCNLRRASDNQQKEKIQTAAQSLAGRPIRMVADAPFSESFFQK